VPWALRNSVDFISSSVKVFLVLLDACSPCKTRTAVEMTAERGGNRPEIVSYRDNRPAGSRPTHQARELVNRTLTVRGFLNLLARSKAKTGECVPISHSARHILRLSCNRFPDN
jgi:hypothetical protein